MGLLGLLGILGILGTLGLLGLLGIVSLLGFLASGLRLFHIDHGSLYMDPYHEDRVGTMLLIGILVGLLVGPQGCPEVRWVGRRLRWTGRRAAMSPYEGA